MKYYEELNFTKNHYSVYNEETNDFKPEDELAELYNVREKMEDDMKGLWDGIIIPYLNDYRHDNILCNLAPNDYHKFYEYMIYNNENIEYVYDRIHDLEHILMGNN